MKFVKRLFLNYNSSMAIILHNSTLKLKIETPGEKYRGSRFDWNGTVTGIWYKGKKILSQEKKLFSRNIRIYGRGLHNEFGIKDAVGYDEVAPGGFFPKIGTGWLVRDDKPYYFYTQYIIDPLEFSFKKISDTKAVFMCDSGIRNGYGYRYIKTLELLNDTFKVSYELENTGEKKIETTEYVHNFLLPGAKSTGPHLELKFNWDFDDKKLTERVNIDDIMDFTSNGIKFKKTPELEFFAGGIWEARKAEPTANSAWILEDSASGIVMSESCDFITCHMDVWGHNRCLSPELFKKISLESGKTEKWNRTYSFSMMH